MSKDFSLCPHVKLNVDKTKKRVEILTGPAYPHFGWNLKKKADTPRIKCSQCGEVIQVLGYIVKRKGTRAHGEEPARKQPRKEDQVNDGEETWRFLD